MAQSSKVVLTHLDKVFWPAEGYTKGDVVDYYTRISSFILPYLKERPESLHRHPNGIDGESFFQKNLQPKSPEWLSTAKIGEVTYLLIQDLDSLLYAVNLGCIELNPFSARVSALDKPDFFIIDLDPVEISFEQVTEVARTCHELLQTLEIPSYCKTSGSRGLHICVPLAAKYSYDQAKICAEIICHLVHQKLPNVTSLERSPSKRIGRVYLDYLQNRIGQTLAAPYSVRPRPMATVSTPLEWKEVTSRLDPSKFTIKTIFRRLEKVGDLFTPVLKKGINLENCLKKLQAYV